MKFINNISVVFLKTGNKASRFIVVEQYKNDRILIRRREDPSSTMIVDKCEVEFVRNIYSYMS